MANPSSDDDRAQVHRWMDHALYLARTAARCGEVPVGAVVLDPEGTMIAEAANAPIAMSDPTAHAEIIVLRIAAQALGNYRLTGCTLIVTLEPCAMCAGAIAHARIGHVVYGADDPKGGAIAHGPKLFDQPTLHHRPRITGGIQAEASSAMLKAFFSARRS